MVSYNIIQYLLSAIKNNYLDKVVFDDVRQSEVFITAVVSSEQRIQPVLCMIEANILTRVDLSAKSVVSFNNSLIVHGIDGITYEIKVIAGN